MRRYSEEIKADVRRQMSPPNRQSVARISEETGIHVATLYVWRKGWRRCLSALLSARGAWVEHLNAVYCALLFMGHESRKSVAFQYPFVGGCAGP